MNSRHLQHLFTAIPGLASALLLTALTNPAAAQSEACVHLQVGAGYAATMAVIFQNATIGPSGSFAIGQTQCLPLTAVGNGVPFSVQVHALAGDTVICTPSDIPRSAALPIAVMFNASGTTLNVHCDAPTGATLEEEPKPLFACPSTDQTGFQLDQHDDTIWCAYPTFLGQRPPCCFCRYDPTTGVLTEDQDFGACFPNAVAVP